MVKRVDKFENGYMAGSDGQKLTLKKLNFS